mmetsp:Transcript_48034/g.114342  ORF Transcript_48034/g.114342 Transcript_48034/m.114342 type:complete len:209 (-) Transcript_48034:6092-6718(-)
MHSRDRLRFRVQRCVHHLQRHLAKLRSEVPLLPHALAVAPRVQDAVHCRSAPRHVLARKHVSSRIPRADRLAALPEVVALSGRVEVRHVARGLAEALRGLREDACGEVRAPDDVWHLGLLEVGSADGALVIFRGLDRIILGAVDDELARDDGWHALTLPGVHPAAGLRRRGCRPRRGRPRRPRAGRGIGDVGHVEVVLLFHRHWVCVH